MATKTIIAAPKTPQKPAELDWVSWPLRHAAPQSWLVPLVLVGVVLLVHSAAGSLFLAVVMALLMATAMWRFFVPVHYHLGREGISIESLGRRRWIAWKEIRSYEIRAAGILLFTSTEPTGLDLLRSLYLPCGDHLPEVLGLLKHYGENPTS